MAVYALGEFVPEIHPDAYVHPDATVIGQVSIGADSTIWPRAVLRGDYGRIIIGCRTSIQDGTVIHVPGGVQDTVIGDDCVVGHLVHMEGCTVEDHCLIGSGSIVLHRVVVGRGAVVGANAVVTNGTVIPPKAMALGIPAKITENAVKEGSVDLAVAVYIQNGHRYAKELRQIS
jgi:carbonic anhydrase/acetyltransferase-like protein (isoleucine patch superfamily)